MTDPTSNTSREGVPSVEVATALAAGLHDRVVRRIARARRTGRAIVAGLAIVVTGGAIVGAAIPLSTIPVPSDGTVAQLLVQCYPEGGGEPSKIWLEETDSILKAVRSNPSDACTATVRRDEISDQLESIATRQSAKGDECTVVQAADGSAWTVRLDPKAPSGVRISGGPDPALPGETEAPRSSLDTPVPAGCVLLKDVTFHFTVPQYAPCLVSEVQIDVYAVGESVDIKQFCQLKGLEPAADPGA